MAKGLRKGRCVRKVDGKGFGFIQDAISQVDLFFHMSDYQPEGAAPPFEQLLFHPQAGQMVVCEAEETQKGWRARKVMVLEEGNE